MKNASKRNWLVLSNAFLLLLLIAPAVSGWSSRPKAEISCEAPSVVKTAHSSGYISFSWTAVPGMEYKTWYVRLSDNYTSQELTSYSASVSYSGLPAGSYRFYFQTICGEGGSSYVVIDDLMM